MVIALWLLHVAYCEPIDFFRAQVDLRSDGSYDVTAQAKPLDAIGGGQPNGRLFVPTAFSIGNVTFFAYVDAVSCSVSHGSCHVSQRDEGWEIAFDAEVTVVYGVDCEVPGHSIVRIPSGVVTRGVDIRIPPDVAIRSVVVVDDAGVPLDGWSYSEKSFVGRWDRSRLRATRGIVVVMDM